MISDAIIVYDLDGTLAWTEKYWLPVMAEVVAHINDQYQWAPAFGALPEILVHLGKPADEIMAHIYPMATTAQIDEILATKADLWKESLEKYPFELYPGTLKTLAAVREMGLRQFVASNCDEVYLDRMLTTTGIGAYIEDAACLGMYPGWEKAAFTKALLEKIPFARGLFVGDSFHDMAAGRANGLATVFARYGYGQSSPDLIDAGIDAIDDLPGQVEAIFMT